jgi:hypothetical protein
MGPLLGALVLTLGTISNNLGYIAALNFKTLRKMHVFASRH